MKIWKYKLISNRVYLRVDMEFGESMKDVLVVNKDFAMLNTGSWGIVPKEVFNHRLKYNNKKKYI